MKQLSLLVLAGLTTGCFAAESAQANPSCWEFVKMLRDPQYGSLIDNSYAGADVLTIPGYADCAEKYDQVERLAYDMKLNSQDREMLVIIHSRLAERLNRHAHSSLEAAIERDETRQALIQETNQHIENAIAILDPSFLDESKKIIAEKTRELTARE